MKNKFVYIMFLMLFTSCDDIFEKDIKDHIVEVVTPKNNMITRSGKVSFLWNPLQGSRGYRLTIVSPSFHNASQLIADTIMLNDSISEKIKYTQILEEGNYQWNIRGINSAYISSDNILDLVVMDN